MVVVEHAVDSGPTPGTLCCLCGARSGSADRMAEEEAWVMAAYVLSGASVGWWTLPLACPAPHAQPQAWEVPCSPLAQR